MATPSATALAVAVVLALVLAVALGSGLGLASARIGIVIGREVGDGALAGEIIQQQLEQHWSRFEISSRHTPGRNTSGPPSAISSTNCLEELADTRTRFKQDRVVAKYTDRVLLIALDSLRMAIYRRLADELNWFAYKLPKF